MLILWVSACGWSSLLPAQETSFSEVRGVLRKRCLMCHNLEEARGGLNLDSPQAIQAGASSGAVVVPGQPLQSLLYRVAAHLDDPKMPPNSARISERELDVIKRWIAGLEASGGADDASSSPPSMENRDPSPPTTNPQPANDWGPVRPLLGPAAVTSLAVHPQENVAAVAGDGQVVLIQGPAGDLLGAIDVPDGDDITELEFSRDGRLLLVAHGVAAVSGVVSAFEWRSGKTAFQVGDELDSVLAMDLSPDGSSLAVAGPEKLVRIYSTADGSLKHTLRKHTDWVLAVQYSPDGLLLASSDRFGAAVVWNAKSGELFHALPGQGQPIRSLAWNKDSDKLLTGGGDGVVRRWEMHHGRLEASWDGEAGPILCLRRTAEGDLAVGGRQGHVTLWDGAGRKLAAMAANDQVETLAGQLDGQWLLLGDASGEVQWLRATSLETAGSFRLPVDQQAIAGLHQRLRESRQEYEQQRARQLTAAEDAVAPDPPSIGEARGVVDDLVEQVEKTQALVEKIRRAQELLRTTEAELDSIRSDAEDAARRQSDLLAAARDAEGRLARIARWMKRPWSDATATDAEQRLAERLQQQQAMMQEAEDFQRRYQQLHEEIPQEVAESMRRTREALAEEIRRTREDLRVVQGLLGASPANSR